MKYSVLMSVYKNERPEYLKQSIESMINQTIQPDQIVIVKDGPITDELQEVLHHYLNKYNSLIEIVNSDKNLGLGLALNLGLCHCKNELVARMDTDDISVPDRCEKQLKVFENDIDLSILGGVIAEFIDGNSSIIGKRILPTNDCEIKTYIKKRCPFNHATVMFKKSDVLKAGGYQDWFYNEDYYLWIRMLEVGCKFANLPEILVYSRVDKNMYKRRGGFKYFKSEIQLQKYMFNKGIICFTRYIYNIIVRFIVQILVPSSIRSIIYKRFLRQ